MLLPSRKKPLAVFPFFGGGLLLLLLILPWWRNHDHLRDFMDYGLVIAANRRGTTLRGFRHPNPSGFSLVQLPGRNLDRRQLLRTNPGSVAESGWRICAAGLHPFQTLAVVVEFVGRMDRIDGIGRSTYDHLAQQPRSALPRSGSLGDHPLGREAVDRVGAGFCS